MLLCVMKQCVAVCYVAVCCCVLCCSVLQCDAVCCSSVQCVAVCCSVSSVEERVDFFGHFLNTFQNAFSLIGSHIISAYAEKRGGGIVREKECESVRERNRVVERDREGWVKTKEPKREQERERARARARKSERSIEREIEIARERESERARKRE